jgi:uncharacterized protein YecE (DUF72 family)
VVNSACDRLRDFESAGTHLERYSRVFVAPEINSSFHRPHCRRHLREMARGSLADFPVRRQGAATITHELKLQDTRDLFVAFLAQTDGLPRNEGPILMQLPPSLSFDASVVTRFLDGVGTPYTRAHGLRAQARDLVLGGSGVAVESI